MVTFSAEIHSGICNMLIMNLYGLLREHLTWFTTLIIFFNVHTQNILEHFDSDCFPQTSMISLQKMQILLEVN